ncbi:MAG: hypothetical protein R3339_02110, partial [Thermodesulfobacteriota bacterium]|nr:hypothetical protein [Thermodesulfobacteriota bacterium]
PVMAQKIARLTPETAVSLMKPASRLGYPSYSYKKLEWEVNTLRIAKIKCTAEAQRKPNAN